MSALSQLLNGNGDDAEMYNSVPEYIAKAPKEVRNRIAALKKLQLKIVDHQADFYKRVHELECEFRERYNKVNAQRLEIISGEYEPAENECDEKIFTWMSEEEQKKFNETVPVSGSGAVKGIPEFWKNALCNCPGLEELVTHDDEEVLNYLTDVTFTQENEPSSFTLEFHFAKNPFFTNTVLTKFFKLSIGPNSFEPRVLYDGPSIIATQGCKIDWKEGQNITQKVVKKKQRKGSDTRESVKVVDKQSLFRFFKADYTEIKENMDEGDIALLNEEFEIGQTIRDSIIDSAVLFYTTECVEDDNLSAFEDDDDLDEEEEEDEE